jgi:uncharacterized membrane protein AbrB (regulator of aidB expression)
MHRLTRIEILALVFTITFSFWYTSDYTGLFPEIVWDALYYFNVYGFIGALIIVLIQAKKLSKYIGVPIVIWVFSLAIINAFLLNKDQLTWQFFCHSKLITFSILGYLYLLFGISFYAKFLNRNKHDH